MAATLRIAVGDLHRGQVRALLRQCGQGRTGFDPWIAQHRIRLMAALEHRRRYQATVGIQHVAAAGVDLLAVAINVVAGFHVMHERQVEHVEPDHRLMAIMAVLVPQAGRRQDQVAAAHRAFLAVDRGPGALALHHHAHRIGRMPMRGRPLAGQQQLHAQVYRRAGLHLLQPVTRVGQHQHATLGLLDRREFAGLQQQRLDRRVGPMRGTRVWSRFVRWQHRTQTGPQGHQVLRLQRGQVFGGQVFEASEIGTHMGVSFRQLRDSPPSGQGHAKPQLVPYLLA